jgi:hypothetical protein
MVLCETNFHCAPPETRSDEGVRMDRVVVLSARKKSTLSWHTLLEAYTQTLNVNRAVPVATAAETEESDTV